MSRLKYDTIRLQNRFAPVRRAEIEPEWVRMITFATKRALMAASVLSLASCASPMSTGDKLNFQAALDAGDYKGAAAMAQTAGHITPDGQTQNVVWSLNAGAAMFDAGDMHNSVLVLDTTEKLAQANDLNHMHAAVDYRYTTYDGVMTNIYKAMAFLAQGDRDNARVELARAEDRQRRAEEHFQHEIAAGAAHQDGNQNAQFGDMLAKAEQSPEYENASNNLSALATYAPFENPFATYIRGIYLLSDGDYSKGMASLKRASQVLGPDSAATADVIWADKAHRSRKPAKPQVWVVFENGQSATYHELRLVLPMVTGQPMTLALPTLVQNPPAYTALQVQAGGTSATTAEAGSFDAVMASEFAKRRPIILAEAVAEVLAKNVGSEIAQKSNNPWLKLASAVAANVSTADTRSWTALPKEFQVARIDAPADGHVTVQTAQGQPLGDVTVPVDHPSIVWVKVQQAGAHPSIQVLPL
jgi:hypothetical protein